VFNRRGLENSNSTNVEDRVDGDSRMTKNLVILEDISRFYNLRSDVSRLLVERCHKYLRGLDLNLVASFPIRTDHLGLSYHLGEGPRT